MISLTAKITKEPRVFQAGDYTGFGLLLGKQYYDRKTKQKVWTNYKCALFAKGNQLNFYQSALVVGSIVEVSAPDCKVDNYNPEYPSIELIDADLVNVFSQNSGAQNQNNAPQQNYQQPQTPQTPAQQMDAVADSIPF